MSLSGKLYDNKGNAYWMDKRAIILKLKDAPKSGKQQRNIGQVIQGILHITKIKAWQLKDHGCWYINRFILMKYKEFGFNLVYFKAVLSDGTPIRGFFHPKLLLNRRYIDYGDYEPQNRLEPADLSPSPQAALKKAIDEKIAQQVAEREEQAKVSEASKQEEPAQKGLFENEPNAA